MDEDGYPSEDFLKYVENFDCMKDDVRILIDALEGEWWSPEWGFHRTKLKNVFKDVGWGPPSACEEGDDTLALELHTGGWSGNEDILRALKKNQWFHMLYWEMSRRGGHECFRFNQLKSWGGGDSHE